MTIDKILEGLDCKVIKGQQTGDVKSLEFDSRKVTDCACFVAVIGFVSDGHDYIQKAVEQGAKLIVADSFRDKEKYPDDKLAELVGDTCTIVETPDCRRALALLAANFYGHPEAELNVAGITGTKGKTTSTFMLHRILSEAGRKAGLIGTVANLIGDTKIKAEHTTPESSDVFRMMRELKNQNIDDLVMEVSSQGLKLDRLYGVKYKVACFTNLFEDHIAPNEHPDMEDYLNCKLKIFDNCEVGIVNADCDVADRVIEYAKQRCKVLTYSIKGDADITATAISQVRNGAVTGSVFEMKTPFFEGTVTVNLPGQFNVANALCAAGCAGVLGVDFEAVKKGLAEVKVPGRVEPVENNLGISVLVDYAHNAASLESVLKTLREYTEGKIITVFGCGGNRAKSRRFEMGEVSGNLSDLTIITSDNPRNEDPDAIIADIKAGIDKTSGKYEIVPDRTDAIDRAIAVAQSGDTVLIAGKGHEDYQIFADKTIHYDDREVAADSVRKAEDK